MQAAYRGPAAARSPRAGTTGSSPRRGVWRGRGRWRRRGPRGTGHRGSSSWTSTLSTSPTGRSAISRSNRVEISRPSATIRETTRPCEATLRPASARTAPKVDPADRSRETSQPSIRNRMEKRYDNDGWQAMEIGRDGTLFSRDVRGVPGRRRRPSSRRPVSRRPGTFRPQGGPDLLDPPRPTLGQHIDRPARLVEKRTPLPPIGNLQCPSVPSPAARWPRTILIDVRNRKLTREWGFCTLDPMKKSLLIAEDDESRFALLRNVFGRSDLLVHEARTGEEALQHIDQHPVDVVLTTSRCRERTGFPCSPTPGKSAPGPR